MDAKSERRSALAVAMMSSFLTPFLASSIVVAIPTMGKEFSISTVTASWIANAYLLAAAAFLVPFGRIADIRGRKWLFLNGMWVFSAATALCIIAPSVETLLVFRIFQGIGSAMIFGTSIAIVTSVYPAAERGKALGLTTMLVYVGLSAGPVLGGMLTQFASWRAIFVAVLPLCGVILFVSYRWLVGEWRGSEGERFDLEGSVVYGFSLTGIVLGLTLLPNLLAVAAIALGLAGIVFFSRLEKRTECPVLDTKLFSHNRAFAFSNAAALINYSATFAVTFMMSFYLQVEKGFDADYAGLVLVSQPILMAVFSPIAGRLSDYVEPQLIASIGMAITATGLVLLALLTTNSSLLIIILSLSILGFGFAFFSSPNTNAIMTSVERKCYGVASATVGTMRLIGQTLSIAVATLFISIYVGNVSVDAMPIPSFHDAFRTSFICFAVLCYIGVFASLARGKVHE